MISIRDGRTGPLRRRCRIASCWRKNRISRSFSLALRRLIVILSSKVMKMCPMMNQTVGLRFLAEIVVIIDVVHLPIVRLAVFAKIDEFANSIVRLLDPSSTFTADVVFQPFGPKRRLTITLNVCMVWIIMKLAKVLNGLLG